MTVFRKDVSLNELERTLKQHTPTRSFRSRRDFLMRFGSVGVTNVTSLLRAKLRGIGAASDGFVDNEGKSAREYAKATLA